MHGPTTSVLSWLLVLLCAASGAYCLGRVRRAGRGPAAAVASGEAVMGFGMAAMAAPLPVGPGLSWALVAVFGAAAVHALWLLRGGVHHAHHLVGSAAMLYMALAASAAGPGQGHGHAAAGVPLLTGALLCYFAGYVLLVGARLVPAGGGPAPVAGAAVPGAAVPGGAGELTRACRLAMGLGMFAMLLAG
ncbi:DUF5134 domain-containing protein [Streptomyces antimicrobicus]|uniref:DUF5134 domain-containing protein n=1 Tax=Streptomyces antimicrobicus TaxID=2883108 RepID=A0ABS8B6I0_9ACTN|nr:DUF5134 domain-containing protein [Streptomyces antimicrobicus]MCB5180209.1 DUF5134 domain-containing protein [Streptomyces antimicrobicus]